jgi:alkaline phosphatase D
VGGLPTSGAWGGAMNGGGMRRRTFLQGVSSLVATGLAARRSVGVDTRAGTTVAATSVDNPPLGLVRTWLGPQLWANRLQDFRVSNGRYECVSTGKLRSVSVLTASLLPGPGSATLSMTTGTLATGTGFSGFLIGVGAGRLDYRAAALGQAASGTAGGLLCTYESDGRCRIRNHALETSQLTYPVLATATIGPAPARVLSERANLTVDIVASTEGNNLFDLTVTARRASDEVLLSRVSLAAVSGASVTGAVLVVSSPVGGTKSRSWFSHVSISGSKVGSHPKRAMGPIIGVLFSVNGKVLKLTAQLFPIGTSEPQDVTLRFRNPGSKRWVVARRSVVGDGYCALLRDNSWDGSQAWEYEVVYGLGSASQASYSGTIPKTPVRSGGLSIGVVNCTIHSYRPLDAPSNYQPQLAGETPQGLYTSRNLYFPYAELTANLARQGPDLLAAIGDQFYENRPTAQDESLTPTLDFLYRYYLWLWSFGHLTANVPCIMLADDHDMFQGNLWGHDGAASTGGDRAGGYVKAASWVNLVQRVQMSHNPDAYDPRPVKQGITVHYAAFTYGGVSFALLEDRKFKYGPTGIDPSGHAVPISALPMLGDRQEEFLRQWPNLHPGQPRIVLSETTYATVKTTPTGGRESDPDNNAYFDARRRTWSLIKAAGAVMVAGDQHLGNVVRHGLTTFTDGPVQFTVPAAGSAWQRWFEPPALPHAEGTPHTGDFTDGYGNKFHVLASVNPVITQAQYVAAYGTSSHNFGDRNLKNEGYGVVRVEPARQRFVLECWRWDTDPTSPGAVQFPGWPQVVPFSAV